MDPYLENPHLWRGVHHSFITFLNSQLNAQLPRPFVARIDERVYIQEEARSIYPDIAVARRPSPSAGNSPVATIERTATEIATASPVRLRLPFRRVTEGFIEVFTAGQREELVSVIEVLSPTNKISGTGQEEYRRKQRELRERGINLLEIDLLRDGPHTVFAPEADLRAQFDHWDYLVSLYQAESPEECDAWPLRLRNILPTVPVPLSGGAPPAALDLQVAFNRTYDEGAFIYSIDYGGEPVPPLSPDDARWADALLKAANLRPLTVPVPEND